MLKELVEGSSEAIHGFVLRQNPGDLPDLKRAASMLHRIAHGAMLVDEEAFLSFKTPDRIEALELDIFQKVLSAAFLGDFTTVQSALAALPLNQKFSFYYIAQAMGDAVSSCAEKVSQEKL